jgi:hypothetical protein
MPLHDQANLYEHAAAQVHSAAAQLGRLSGSDAAAASAVAYAACDTLTATARIVEGQRRGRLHRAGEAFDRAAREPYRRRLPPTRDADGLRATARLLRLAGELSGDKDLAQVRRLVIELALLADVLADLRDIQRRLHQARAARTAARLLRTGVADRVTGGPRHWPNAASTAVPSTGTPTHGRDPRRRAGPDTGRAR